MTALRTAIVAPLRALDHRLGRALTPARVLVDVRTPMNLAVLEPVWRPLLADPRVTVLFAGGGHAPVNPWTRIDVAMTADLWHQTPLRRCRRRINFFHGVAGKYDLDRPEKLHDAALERFDRVAFINRERMTRYLECGAVRPDQAVLVGYPKADRLVNGGFDAAAVRASLGLRDGRPTVLYAPTFSTANSLHLAGEAIVSSLLDAGCNVIVKLHDRSMVPTPQYTAGIDWPARLGRFERHPQFALAREADASPYLAAADVLVTDHSTVGFEFALLDRPLIVFDAPELLTAARVDPQRWALLRAMADVVASPADLPRAVAQALAAPGGRREARRRAHDLFAYAGTATDRALQVVYELLDLRPLVLPETTSSEESPELLGEPRPT